MWAEVLHINDMQARIIFDTPVSGYATYQI